MEANERNLVPPDVHSWTEHRYVSQDPMEVITIIHGVENQHDVVTLCGQTIAADSILEIPGTRSISCPDCLRIMKPGR